MDRLAAIVKLPVISQEIITGERQTAEVQQIRWDMQGLLEALDAEEEETLRRLQEQAVQDNAAAFSLRRNALLAKWAKRVEEAERRARQGKK
ncbi:MAG: hypothetical protein Q9181_005430 [Wetmoreana brouardii]